MVYRGNKRVFSFSEDKDRIDVDHDGRWWNIFDDGTEDGPYPTEFTAKFCVPASFRNSTVTIQKDPVT